MAFFFFRKWSYGHKPCKYLVLCCSCWLKRSFLCARKNKQKTAIKMKANTSQLQKESFRWLLCRKKPIFGRECIDSQEENPVYTDGHVQMELGNKQTILHVNIRQNVTEIRRSQRKTLWMFSVVLWLLIETQLPLFLQRFEAVIELIPCACSM